jgi:predicted ABC-type ATPase
MNVVSEKSGIFAADMEEKHLYIIAGPNGAGKTTASYSVLQKILQCREFVNADEIARGLSPFNPESVAIEAGQETTIKNEVEFKTIAAYVKH